jgi:hypothetical protein
MNRLVLGLTGWAVFALSGIAQGAQKSENVKQANKDPAKEFTAIEKDWSDAEQAFLKAYQSAKTPDERKQVLKEKRPKPDAFAERCLKLADAHPDSPESLKALAWVMSNAGRTPVSKAALPKLKEKLSPITDLDRLQTTLSSLPPNGLNELAPPILEKVKTHLDHPKALPLLLWVCQATVYGPSTDPSKPYNNTVDLIMARFSERPELTQLAGWLGQDDDPAWAEKHLRKLLEKNPSEAVKNEAAYGLAVVLKNKDEASQPEAEKLLTSIIENKSAADKNMAERAKSDLEDMKVHGIGKSVPDIVGADLDGKEFKLSDYKGKVVLLDFWGFW